MSAKDGHVEHSTQMGTDLQRDICQIAEEIESVLGLKPLPEPADVEEPSETRDITECCG